MKAIAGIIFCIFIAFISIGAVVGGFQLVSQFKTECIVK